MDQVNRHSTVAKKNYSFWVCALHGLAGRQRGVYLKVAPPTWFPWSAPWDGSPFNIHFCSLGMMPHGSCRWKIPEWTCIHITICFVMILHLLILLFIHCLGLTLTYPLMTHCLMMMCCRWRVIKVHLEVVIVQRGKENNESFAAMKNRNKCMPKN